MERKATGMKTSSEKLIAHEKPGQGYERETSREKLNLS